LQADQRGALFSDDNELMTSFKKQKSSQALEVPGTTSVEFSGSLTKLSNAVCDVTESDMVESVGELTTALNEAEVNGF